MTTDQKKAYIVTGAISLAAAALMLLLTGCGHNTGVFTIGTRVNAGLDPQNATANISYTDGLNVVDVSRENSGWDIQVDADNGVSVDSKSGAVKGIKRLKREVGPQITGYLVDLAAKDPEMAKIYIQAVADYWSYRKSQNSSSTAKDNVKVISTEKVSKDGIVESSNSFTLGKQTTGYDVELSKSK